HAGRVDPDGARHRSRQRTVRTACPRDHRRAPGLGGGDGLPGARGLSPGAPQRWTRPGGARRMNARPIQTLRQGLATFLLLAAPLAAQSPANPTAPAANAPASTLSRQQAEALALKNNPQITIGRLRLLAAAQFAREQRSALLPSAYLSLTGVDASDRARIAAGGLNNPIIYPRVATGATVSQLLTDFGRTTSLVSSAKASLKAEEESS